MAYQLYFAKCTSTNDFHNLKVACIHTAAFDYFTGLLIWKAIKPTSGLELQELSKANITTAKLLKLTSLKEVFDVFVASEGREVTITDQRLNPVLANETEQLKYWVTWQYDSSIEHQSTYQKPFDIQFIPRISDVTLKIFSPLSLAHLACKPKL